MGRRCTVCQHPDTQEIDVAIIDSIFNRRSLRSIAEEFGLSRNAVWRHKNSGCHVFIRVQEAEQITVDKGEQRRAKAGARMRRQKRYAEIQKTLRNYVPTERPRRKTRRLSKKQTTPSPPDVNVEPVNPSGKLFTWEELQNRKREHGV